jgi:hypothetical protein
MRVDLVTRAAWLRRSAVAVAVAAALIAAAGPDAARAASWSTIEPGVSTQEDVRGRFGPPSRESQKKVDGYDTMDWVYEGGRAPSGIIRMTVEFGLLTPQGYKANSVRALRLEPKPMIFGRNTIVDGWGVPERMAEQGDRDVFLYESGLIVTFDKDGASATSMVFMVPQKVAPGSAAPASPRAPGAPATPAPPASPPRR